MRTYFVCALAVIVLTLSLAYSISGPDARMIPASGGGGNSSSGANLAGTEQPVDAQPRVVVDKSSNSLSYYLGEQLIRTMPVATGESEDVTPEGEFRVVVKGRYPDWLNRRTNEVIPGGSPENPLGSRWIGLDVPGTAGYIYGIHGTNDRSTIGKYVTNGCIRLANEDVEWLYDRVDLGTPVLIRRSSDANTDEQSSQVSLL